MKNRIMSLLLFLPFFSGFSQNSAFEYTGRLNPSVKNEKLKVVESIEDITPELWNKLLLPNKERHELEERRKTAYHGLAYFIYPLSGYNIIIDYVSVEISAYCKGKKLSSRNTSDELTIAQKYIVNNADLGTDIILKIKFKYKNNEKDKPDNDKVVEGVLPVKVVPETEAKFPGGDKQINEYLKNQVISKITERNASEKLRQAIVKFTINEEGRIVDTKVFRTSTDPEIDKLLLVAFNKMPKWSPAKNSKGIKVKQQFTVPFGNNGC